MTAAASGPPLGADAPIGVFDSGVGGLTVLAALRARLPQERYLYLGDTARLPYGTKSGETVVRYALQAADALVARGIKALVVACNTASAVALPAIAARHAGLPVIGVVEPGAEAACAATRRGHVAVIATEGTIRGGAYQRAIHRLRPELRVEGIACAMFVALAEEGWNEGAIAAAVAHRYLDPLFGPQAGTTDARPDVLVLGCTHFPLLVAPLREVVGEGVRIVDSAATTAAAVEQRLRAAGRLREADEAQGSRDGHDDVEARAAAAAAIPASSAMAWTGTRFLATDGAERFARIGASFLGMPLAAAQVELVDL